MSSISSRLGISTDPNSTPWTDVKDNQQKDKVAVQSKKELQDLVPGRFPNELHIPLQGIVLKPQLYRQSANRYSEIAKEQLRSEEIVKLIVNAV